MSDPLGLISNAANRPHGVSPTPPRPPAAPGQGDGPDFKDVLMEHLKEVNRLQHDAEIAIEDLHAGRRDDVDAVLMAKQKADIAFQMLLQVRNKMMSAYEEIKQVQV